MATLGGAADVGQGKGMKAETGGERGPPSGAGAGDRRGRFAARLDAVDRSNGTLLLVQLDEFRPSSRDFADVAELRAQALAEWDRRAAGTASSSQNEVDATEPVSGPDIEDAIVRRFAGQINALRLQAFGIDQYTWRSRNGERACDLHSYFDGKVFDWEEPTDDGYPGDAEGCFCVAEPYFVMDDGEEPWRPTIDDSYAVEIEQGRRQGAFEAVEDFCFDVLPGVAGEAALDDALADLSALSAEAGELASLVVRDFREGLDDDQRARCDDLVGNAQSWCRTFAGVLARQGKLKAAALARLGLAAPPI